MIHRSIYSISSGLLKRQLYFQSQISFSSMSRRRTYIELEEIPTLKQAYEERNFSPRNLKRAATLTRKYDHNEEFNKKISLIQADITKLKIDAIVNAANETLLGGGGVDGAIHRAAGPELRHECWDLNGCETGDAKITKGYDLPSKHVIHTVGPVGEKPHLLRSAYERSMQVMCENDLKSIAFSNISTGVYGYPRPKAGHLALDTMRKWLEQNPDYFKKLERIIFCVFEDENKDVYETLFPIYFPPPVDINEYVKEEEKSRPKTNEEKKDNEAEKDKDQVKTLTSLTAEQVNVNKEIIGIDNNNGVKEKDEKKNHETLTTGQVSTDKDKENKEKVEDKDEENKEKGEDKEDKDKEDKDKVEDNDKENKEKVEDNDKENKEKVENNDKENKGEVENNDKENKGEVENNDKENKEEVEDKDKENKEEVEDKDKKNKEGVEDKDKTQNTDMYVVSTEKDNHDTGMSVEQDKQSTDVSTESNKQDKQVTGAESIERDKHDIEMLNATTEPNIPDEANKQDEDKIMSDAAEPNIPDEANKQDEDTTMQDAATATEQVKNQKQNEPNSKKRSHDDTSDEAEQGDDAKGSQNNITMTKDMTKDIDVHMEDAEPTTDVFKMDEDGKGDDKTGGGGNSQNEQSQETSQTGGKNEDDNVTKVPENNSKI